MPLIAGEFIKKEVLIARLNVRDWALRADMMYRGKDQDFIIPRGFVTDFASVPRIFMSLFPSTGAYTLAAILHDWFCTMLGMRKSPVSAVDADGLLRRVSEEQGTDFVTRWAMWTGVRWGALFNPARRAGWWSTFPKVLFWSIVLLPAILCAAVGVGLALFWLLILQVIAELLFRLK